MTDTDYVLEQLQAGPHTTMQLIRKSIERRGCGLTPHSRVADLRRDGYDIRCQRVGSANGRGIYQYTLIGERAPVELRPSVGQGQPWADSPIADPPDVIPGQLRLVG